MKHSICKLAYTDGGQFWQMVSVILIGLSFTNKISDPAYFESFSQPKYTTVPKINPTVYNFQRPFLRGLFLEGLHFGGVYIRWEICVTKFIGLAYGWKANKKLSVTIPLLICYFVLFFFSFLSEGNFQV